jgi:hypothetical protein
MSLSCHECHLSLDGISEDAIVDPVQQMGGGPSLTQFHRACWIATRICWVCDARFQETPEEAIVIVTRGSLTAQGAVLKHRHCYEAERAAYLARKAEEETAERDCELCSETFSPSALKYCKRCKNSICQDCWKDAEHKEIHQAMEA